MASVFRGSLLLAALVLASCTAGDPYQRTKTGAALGALAGAIVGHQIDDKQGRFVGAALGAAVGGGVGYMLDRQYQQLQALAAENERLGMTVQRLQNGGVKLSMPNGVTFAVDSDRVRGEFYPVLARVADILNEDDRSRVTVVGHTDSTGNSFYNLDLSRRRAENVAGILGRSGVNHNRLYTDGRGEEEPVASNETAAGRQANRRVEILLTA